MDVKGVYGNNRLHCQLTLIRIKPSGTSASVAGTSRHCRVRLTRLPSPAKVFLLCCCQAQLCTVLGSLLGRKAVRVHAVQAIC
jgi:hypothetical protein